jgi:hypothetical protein
MVIVLFVLVVIWAGSVRRWTMVWSLVSSLAFLIAGTSLLIQDWVVQYLRQILVYAQAVISITPGGLFRYWLPGVGVQMGWVFTVFAIGILFWEWRSALGKEFRWFLWTAYLTLVMTNLIGLRTSPENYVALLPGLIMVLGTWDERWGRLGRGLVLASILLLFFGNWAIFLRAVENVTPSALVPAFFFFFPFFMLIGLFWVRWWSIRPPRLYLEELAAKVG